MRSKLFTALTALCGLVLGVATSLLAGSLMREKHHKSDVVLSLDDPRPTATHDPASPSRMGRRAAPALRAQPGAPTSPAATPPTAEESERQHRERFEAELRRHGDERWDREWAEKSTASLTSELGELAKENGFSLASVDCRSVTCVASFDWSSYQSASDLYALPLHAFIEPNCAREIFLPMPADRSARYRGSMLVDCARERR